MNKTKLYKTYEGKFCKVVIDTERGEKSLKGKIQIEGDTILVDGSYQRTLLRADEIKRITTKLNGEQNNVKQRA